MKWLIYFLVALGAAAISWAVVELSLKRYVKDAWVPATLLDVKECNETMGTGLFRLYPAAVSGIPNDTVSAQYPAFLCSSIGNNLCCKNETNIKDKFLVVMLRNDNHTFNVAPDHAVLFEEGTETYVWNVDEVRAVLLLCGGCTLWIWIPAAHYCLLCIQRNKRTYSEI